jgi:glycine cleavage system H protein
MVKEFPCHDIKGEFCGPPPVVESSKSASDVYIPIAGEVVAVNEAVVSSPETINQNPYEGGWLIKIKPSNASELNDLIDPNSYSQIAA